MQPISRRDAFKQLFAGAAALGAVGAAGPAAAAPATRAPEDTRPPSARQSPEPGDPAVHAPDLEIVAHGLDRPLDVRVVVGRVEGKCEGDHPQEHEHHIESIELYAEGRFAAKAVLAPRAVRPEARFSVHAAPGEVLTAFAVCSRHGRYTASIVVPEPPAPANESAERTAPASA